MQLSTFPQSDMGVWHGSLAVTWQLYDDAWEKTVELFTYDPSRDIFEDFQ